MLVGGPEGSRSEHTRHRETDRQTAARVAGEETEHGVWDESAASARRGSWEGSATPAQPSGGVRKRDCTTYCISTTMQQHTSYWTYGQSIRFTLFLIVQYRERTHYWLYVSKDKFNLTLVKIDSFIPWIYVYRIEDSSQQTNDVIFVNSFFPLCFSKRVIPWIYSYVTESRVSTKCCLFAHQK